jgi:hypothetical protein
VDTDGNPPDDAEDPPFNTVLAANVGIFNYEVLQLADGGTGDFGCVPYDDKFTRQTGYPSIATAQFCALIAPIFGSLAIFATLFDLCACKFPGSFLISTVLFLVAASIQAGTFTLIADPAFWYEAEGFATCSFIV